MATVWHVFQECGFNSWLCLLAGLGAFALSLVAIVVASLRVRVATLLAGAALGVALLPTGVGLVGRSLGRVKVDAAISGTGIDPEQRQRIRVEGYREAKGIGRPNGVAVGAELVSLPVATGDETSRNRPSCANHRLTSGILRAFMRSARARAGFGRAALAHHLVAETTPRGDRLLFEQDGADNLLSRPGLSRMEVQKGNLVKASSLELFGHDERARLALRQQQDGSRVRYGFDSFDMLIRVESVAPTGESEVFAEFEYDALGRRIACDFGAKEREFYWDLDRLAAEVGPGGELRVYQYASREALVPIGFTAYESRTADPSTGKSFIVFSDQLGMPLCIEDEHGTVVWWANRVDPYGLVEVRADSTIEYNVRWPGHYFDPETGLHYNRYRYYDPLLGRYLQPDPIGHAGSPVNLYSYCPNPTVQVDLLGLDHSGKSGRSGSDEGEENDGRARTSRPAEEDEVSPITGQKVDNAATVVEHSVDGEVVARYYVDEQGRTVQAEGKLDPPETYKKVGVSKMTPPEGYESGRDHRGHLIPERSAADQHEPAPLWWTSRKGLFSSEFRQCSREKFVQIHSRKTPSGA